MNRVYLLPVASGIALGLTACSSESGWIGDWSVTSYTYDGQVYNLPYESVYVDSGVTYTEISGLRLEIKDEGRAAFGYYYEYSSSDGYLYADADLYAGSWNKSGRTFEFDFPDGELSMDCTRDADELACDGDTDGEPVFIELVRLAEADE